MLEEFRFYYRFIALHDNLNAVNQTSLPLFNHLKCTDYFFYWVKNNNIFLVSSLH